MSDEELQLSVVYNGEIYNFQQWREELQKKGYTFRSTSDTEILLKGYHA
jgi:asparagine synthase (glutamine-hydrolysing)